MADSAVAPPRGGEPFTDAEREPDLLPALLLSLTLLLLLLFLLLALGSDVEGVPRPLPPGAGLADDCVLASFAGASLADGPMDAVTRALGCATIAFNTGTVEISE